MSKVLQEGLLRYYFTHAQSCDNVHVQSATEWAASVHTLHMPKAVIKFVFNVYRMDCWRTYTLHMPKAVITFVFNVLRNGLRFRRFRVFAVFVFSRFRAWRFRVFVFRRRHPLGRNTDFVCTVTLPLSCYSAWTWHCRNGAPSLSSHLHSSRKVLPAIRQTWRDDFPANFNANRRRAPRW